MTKPRGRPSVYKAVNAEQAYKLCLLGATDADLADFFEVDERTINRWKRDHPEFCQSIKGGKRQADATVAESLYKRANGYKHDAVKIFQYEGFPVVVPYVEHYPPDTAAGIFWLKNRRPDLWRDKQETSGASIDISIWEEPEFLERIANGEDPYRVAADRMRALAAKTEAA